jgi:hypothetical protein
MVDGTTASTLTFNSTNPGTTDICGDPTPIADSINTNFNDASTTVSVTISHTSSTATISIVSNLAGTRGAWGVREFNLTMEACD